MMDKEVTNWDYSSDMSNKYSVSFFDDVYNRWLELSKFYKYETFLVLSKEAWEYFSNILDKEYGG